MKTLVFSESFVDFLHKIAPESKIARLIIGCRRAKNDGFNFLYEVVLKSDEVNYITYRNNGMVSFMPADREQEYNDDNTWKRDGRQEGKPAKVMRRIFTKNALKCLKDSDFEIFNNKYKSQYSTNDFTFEVLPAEEIADVYCMDRMDGGASLNGSCMNDDSSYLEMYTQCSSLEIIVLKTADGKLAGRALLWTLTHNGENIKLADRFYVAEDHLYDSFVNYVEENKWWRKKYFKTYDFKQQFITPDKQEVVADFTVNTDTCFDEYPYIDTFQYGGDGYLTNKDGQQYTYNQTGGTRDGEGVWDDIDERDIDPEDAVTIDSGRYRNNTTHIDNTVTIDGNYWYKEDDDIRYIDGTWYHCDDVVYSDYDGDDYLLEDCVYSEHHSTWILKTDAYKVADDYFHQDVVEKL
jgi:hypothetical protein